MLKLSILGNLGDDARVLVSNGDKFLAFNVAHTFRFTDRQTGAITESTTWVSVTIAGERPNLLPFLVKGTKVYCEGNASTRCYVGNDGHHHAGLNLSCSFIELCGSKREEVKNENTDTQGPF